MIRQNYIQKSCRVADNRVYLNGKVCFEAADLDFSAFAKQAFKAKNAAYPKFYKMDALSRLAVLAAEYLLADEVTDELALVLANRSGSLDTDVQHQQTIQDEQQFFPSPATFVYTLANICAGEISIRHSLQTEQVFFVAETYPVETIAAYAAYLLASQKAKRVLCGWVEFFEGNYEAVLYIVGQHGEQQHIAENIAPLFCEKEGLV
ncbi:hypothetical protein PQ465_19620 [Sphingobacterium oryzagri]|uniref:3-oxoacyl-ACP synthase n=1 Tax=Sphingobacterium oryzagri TaxID=3025669 RepID=A0ABY7WFV5_9SPHI|nr:hypothetical protein [Sphingobacterium sp. KACC 22765]WDF68491.1 hypothetical protein PQ465_19620 [Sphingobacterium sp. KACC 22765]